MFIKFKALGKNLLIMLLIEYMGTKVCVETLKVDTILGLRTEDQKAIRST